MIPKTHGEKLHDIPDDELAELLPVAKKLALAAGAVDYNILQNNGQIAHQEVGHVHVHMVSSCEAGYRAGAAADCAKIPKPNATEGLIVGWPMQKTDMEQLKALGEELKSRM